MIPCRFYHPGSVRAENRSNLSGSSVMEMELGRVNSTWMTQQNIYHRSKKHHNMQNNFLFAYVGLHILTYNSWGASCDSRSDYMHVPWRVTVYIYTHVSTHIETFWPSSLFWKELGTGLLITQHVLGKKYVPCTQFFTLLSMNGQFLPAQQRHNYNGCIRSSIHIITYIHIVIVYILYIINLAKLNTFR